MPLTSKDPSSFSSFSSSSSSPSNTDYSVGDLGLYAQKAKLNAFLKKAAQQEQAKQAAAKEFKTLHTAVAKAAKSAGSSLMEGWVKSAGSKPASSKPAYPWDTPSSPYIGSVDSTTWDLSKSIQKMLKESPPPTLSANAAYIAELQATSNGNVTIQSRKVGLLGGYESYVVCQKCGVTFSLTSADMLYRSSLPAYVESFAQQHRHGPAPGFKTNLSSTASSANGHHGPSSAHDVVKLPTGRRFRDEE